MKETQAVRYSSSRKWKWRERGWLVLGVAACLGGARSASAVSWWLPTNYSEHGGSVDALFNFIFWLTTIINVAVFVVMGYFLVRYRHNPNRKKAHFTHGNPRLEMTWTIAPAIVLAFIALITKGVWERYRAQPQPGDHPAKLMVIGQQFKWNVVYSGPDGKLGKYLVFPKPTDKEWPRDPENQPVEFAGVKGPADLPFEKAMEAINAYIDQENPLGKVFNDPDGKDDNWEKTPGREITVPANRPIEITLSSKDVIHSFFLPNFRVKLDAVPGLRGMIAFKAKKTSGEREQEDKANRKPVRIEDLIAELTRPENRNVDRRIEVKEGMAGASFDNKAKQWLVKDAQGKTIIRDGAPISVDALNALKAMGVKEVKWFKPGYFELVCEELCGSQHYTMRGTLVVLPNEEYVEQFEAKQDTAKSNAHEDSRSASAK
jgi:heme/copper-type cytochrome/quinol oxidase subunit 2